MNEIELALARLVVVVALTPIACALITAERAAVLDGAALDDEVWRLIERDLDLEEL